MNRFHGYTLHNELEFGFDNLREMAVSSGRVLPLNLCVSANLKAS